MRRASLCLAAATVTAAVPACLACDDLGCGGGFEWTARADDESALPAGTYDVTITLEESVYELACEVGMTYADSECSEPERVSGSVDFRVDFGLTPLDEGAGPGQTEVGGMGFYALDRSESDEDGLYSANRGPTLVEIEVKRGDTVVLDEHYDVSYERNEDFRGDARCGYCDSYEERTAVWNG